MLHNRRPSWCEIDATAVEVSAESQAGPARVRLIFENGDITRIEADDRPRMVERTFSWFGRNRRLAKDFENLAETLATFVTLTSIQLALRRLAGAWVVNSTNTGSDDGGPEARAVPAAKASGRYGFGEATFAGTRSSDGNAPEADLDLPHNRAMPAKLISLPKPV
jgi:putative transposase